MCEICKSLHEFPWRFLDECSTFLDMMNDTGIDKKHQCYVIKKMINIAIRATYIYIFCCINRNWDSPDLMQFWFYIYIYIFWLLFCFCFLFFFCFVIIQSQAAFVNCLYVARFTIVHSKTQIKFPLLLLFVVLPDCLSVVVVLCLKNYGTSRHCKYTCTLYVNSFYFLFFVVVVFSEN